MGLDARGCCEIFLLLVMKFFSREAGPGDNAPGRSWSAGFLTEKTAVRPNYCGNSTIGRSVRSVLL